MRGKGRYRLAIGAAALLSIASSAAAEDRRVGTKAPDEEEAPGPTPTWTIDGGLWIVSDYRSGGISSSNGKPALQAQIAVDHRSGLFARAWGSSIAPTDGGTVELNLTTGYGFDVGAVTSSLGATLYLFPGIDHSSYVELFQELAIPVGKSIVTLGAAWTPRQAHVPTSNFYLGAVAEMPVGKRWTIDAALGRENGAFGDRKLDWWLGFRRRIGQLELGAAYADSRRAFAPHAGPTVIASAGIVF